MASPITNLVLRGGVGPDQSPSAIVLHTFAPLGGASTPADAFTARRGAPHIAWTSEERLYLPPGRWTKKRKTRAIKALKELYKDARGTIPEQQQIGLLPAAFTKGARAVSALPPMRQVDFEALAQSIETIRVLIAALEQAQGKRRREEAEALIMILTDI